MKVAIIVGHDERAQGAITYNKITEYDFNTFVANEIKNLHMFKISHGYAKFKSLHVINRNNGWQSVANQLKANDCDLSIELHLNSFTKAAYGVETLYLENDLLSFDFAKNLSFKIARFYNSKLRHEDGTLESHEGDRGNYNLKVVKNAGVKIAVLVEPTFVSHLTRESEQLINNPLGYAGLLYQVLEDFVISGENFGINSTIN
jgi:N-acetylmuramoyl-L-alanine amidase